MANQEVWEFPFRWAQILRSDLDDSQKIAVLEERDRSVEEVINGIICCGRLEFTYRWAQIFPLITSEDPYDRTMGYELLEENDRVLEDTLNNCNGGSGPPPDAFAGYTAHATTDADFQSVQFSTSGFDSVTISTFRVVVDAGVPDNADLRLNIYDSGLSLISSTIIDPSDFTFTGGHGVASVSLTGGPVLLDGDEYVEFAASDGLGNQFGLDADFWAHRSGADFGSDVFQAIEWPDLSGAEYCRVAASDIPEAAATTDWFVVDGIGEFTTFNHLGQWSSPATITFESSPDGSTWTTLHTQNTVGDDNFESETVGISVPFDSSDGLVYRFTWSGAPGFGACQTEGTSDTGFEYFPAWNT